MRRKFAVFALFIIIISFMFLENSFGEEQSFVKRNWRKFLDVFKKPKPEKKPQVKPKPPVSELKESEIKERIKNILETTPEIADFIPELEDVDLDQLSKEELIKIYNRINIENTRLQTERIQSQLEAVRVPPAAPRAPEIIVQPSVPKAPPVPPKAPALPPPLPPSPPRR